MNDVARQERALLELVEGERERRCAALIGEAQARAAAQREQSRAESLARIRGAFALERRRRLERVAAAHSRAATQRRLHEQRRAAAMLLLAADELPAALRELWHDAAARHAWVARVADMAVRQLGAEGGWQVRHPADWPADEQAGLARALSAPGHPEPRFAADPALDAGLRLVADGNVIDGTVAGLLADREDVEARLLRRLEVEEAAR